MDHERHDELLTAYLDRELSPDERAAVDRLLENSDEARQRLRELDATSSFLRKLPRRALEQDFADSVVDRLRRESLLWPVPVEPLRRARPWGGWIGGSLAAAATLVLTVWMGRGVFNRDQVRFALSPVPTDSIAASDLLAKQQANSPDDEQSVANRAAPAEAEMLVEEFRSPVAIRIVSESGEQEIGLLLLSQPDKKNELRGILVESKYLAHAVPPSGAADELDGADSIAIYLAKDADVAKMGELVHDWTERNSAPIVDLAIEPVTASAEADAGEAGIEFRRSLVMDRNSLPDDPARSGNTRETTGSSGKIASGRDRKSDVDIAPSAATAPAPDLAKTAPGQRGVRSENVDDSPVRGAAAPVQRLAGDKSGETSTASKAKHLIESSEAGGPEKSNQQLTQRPSGRARVEPPDTDQKDSAAPAFADKDRLKAPAKTEGTLPRVKNLLQGDESQTAARRERWKVLLQPIGGSDAPMNKKRN